MTPADPQPPAPPPAPPDTRADPAAAPDARESAWSLWTLSKPGHAGVENLRTACLLVLAALGIMLALYLLRAVLVPFVLAVFLSLLVSPLINAMVHRLRWPRALAVLITFLLAIAVLVGTIAALVPAAIQIVSAADDYGRRLFVLTEAALDRLGLDELTEPEPLHPADDPDVVAGDAPPSAEPRQERSVLAEHLAAQSLPWITATAYRFGGNIMGFIIDGTLVSIFLLFLLMGRGDAPLPPHSLRAQVERQIQAFIGVTFVVSVVTGVLVGLTLELLGVPLGWLFGVLAFLLNFIPNVGSIIATLLPLPVVVLDPVMSPTAKLLAFAVPAVIQFSIGNVLVPKILGDRLTLSPVAVLLGLIFFGTIWGAAGMFLAAPMLATMRIAFERVPLLRPVADALAGRIGRRGEPAG